MTDITSEDIFLGRKQEDFDLAEKLLVKHGKLNTKCVREMADAVYGRMGIVECHKILQRVWNDMHVKRLEDENVKLRELLQRLLTEYRYMRSRPRKVYLQHEGRMRAIEEEMRELGIEVDG